MLERLTDSDYQQKMTMLQKMLDHYLETGEMLKIMV